MPQTHTRFCRWVRPGAALVYAPQYVPSDAADGLFQQLQTELGWEQGSIRMFGRLLAEPRFTAWCGDTAYRYSGRTLAAKPWHPVVSGLRDQVSEALDRLQIHTARGLNHALFNLYPDGAASMGWHRDNEPELGAMPVICSLSLGAARRFVLRPRDRGRRAEQLEFQLGHGDLLVMYGDSQTEWEHALLKTKTQVGPRLNLTFRSVRSH